MAFHDYVYVCKEALEGKCASCVASVVEAVDSPRVGVKTRDSHLFFCRYFVASVLREYPVNIAVSAKHEWNNR